MSSLLALTACGKKDEPKPTTAAAPTAPAVAPAVAPVPAPPTTPPPATATTTTGSAAPSGDPAWTPYASSGGRYTVNLPGTPKETSAVLDSPQGKVTMYQAMLPVREGGQQHLYILAYDDVPVINDPDKLLDGAIDGVAKIVNGTITTRSNVMFGKSPGRAATIQAAAGTANARIYLVGKRQYQLIAVSDPASTTKFFDSFTLAP